MCEAFILITQKDKKLAAKHLPFFLRHPVYPINGKLILHGFMVYWPNPNLCLLLSQKGKRLTIFLMFTEKTAF